MRILKSALLKFMLCLAAGFSCTATATTPTRVLVGFSPGGTTDIIARLVSDGMSKQLPSGFIVENRPGASGNIAAGEVADSTADGHTLLFAPSSHATNATLYDTRFNTEKDFAAVGMVASTPYVLVVHPSLPVHTTSEFIEYLRKHPGEVAYASASPGTAQHLAGEMFKRMAGVDMLHVPYKGSAAAFPDLAAGRTPVMFDNIAVVLPHIRSGAVRALAVTSTARSPLLPKTPTVAESGLPKFEMSGWFALFAPRATTSATVNKLNQALNAAIKNPEFTQKLQALGAEIIMTSPNDADAFITSEIAKWRAVIREAGISLK